VTGGGVARGVTGSSDGRPSGACGVAGVEGPVRGRQPTLVGTPAGLGHGGGAAETIGTQLNAAASRPAMAPAVRTVG
jgi:hypothetical protein